MQCYGMAKAFRDEQQKRQMRKDDESDDGKEEQSKDARLAFQDANKTVATIFRGCAASESKR